MSNFVKINNYLMKAEKWVIRWVNLDFIEGMNEEDILDEIRKECKVPKKVKTFLRGDANNPDYLCDLSIEKILKLPRM